MWRGGSTGLTWLEPGTNCAGSGWVERLDLDKTFVVEILQIKVNYRHKMSKLASICNLAPVGRGSGLGAQCLLCYMRLW